MIIVTPASELLHDSNAYQRIRSVSDSLELRPERNFPFLEGQSFSHCHVSDPELDINLRWDAPARGKLLKMLEIVSEIPPTLSFHVARDYETIQFSRDGKYMPTGRRMEKMEMLENLCTNVTWLRTQFFSELLVENNNYYRTGAYEIVTSPEFLFEAVEMSGVGLLFDYAHALVSAFNLKIDSREYIQGLPLEKTRQLHVSQPQVKNGEMFDTHGLPGKTTVERAIRLVRQSTSAQQAVTIEYYQDPNNLIKLLSELREGGDYLT